MIHDVLTYVLSEPYQRLPQGYGLLREGPGHYYAMGWDILLPPRGDGALTARVLHRMELLAAFPPAVHTPWFQENLALLLRCQASDGMFSLPRAALPEKESYWVLGGHMALVPCVT